MSLLDQFTLQHVQYSLMHAELHRVVAGKGDSQARVELNLTPRLLKTDSGEQLPAYQLSARLSCKGVSDADGEPVFSASVALEAIYQQTVGEAVDLSAFSKEHTALARQVYPLLQQRMRALLSGIGLTRLNLPFDLVPSAGTEGDAPTVEVSSVIH